MGQKPVDSSTTNAHDIRRVPKIEDVGVGLRYLGEVAEQKAIQRSENR